MTYDKKVVLAAANKTAQAMRAERQVMLVEWDSKSIVTRFFLCMFGLIRPAHHGVSKQKIAERVSFKASFCKEESMSLFDDEIDALRDWWLVNVNPEGFP